MTGHHAHLNNRKVAYWTSAPHLTNGMESVLLIHGFGGTYSGLEDLSSLLEEHYNVIGLDLPGYGLSEPLRSRHTLRNYARFINDFCAGTEFHKVHVVGHSFGADIAIVFAAMYPERVAKLVLISPVILTNNSTARLARFYYKTVAKLPSKLRHKMLHNHTLTRLSDSYMFKQASEQQRNKILRDDYISDHLMSDAPVIESYLSLLATPFYKLASRIKSPTLILSGSKDPIALRDTVAELAQNLHHSKLEIADGAGHFLPLETPKPVAKKIIDFLNK